MKAIFQIFLWLKASIAPKYKPRNQIAGQDTLIILMLKQAYQPQYQVVWNRQVHPEPGSHQVRVQKQSTEQAFFFTEAKAQYSSRLLT